MEFVLERNQRLSRSLIWGYQRAFYERQGFRKEGLSEISLLGRLIGIGPVFSYAKAL